MNKKIIGYTRVSTREQVEGFSLSHQEKQIYVKVDMLGLTKRGVKLFSEEGVSAKNFNRPKIKEVIEMIKKEEVEMIIIYKFDRLTRSMVDLVNFIELCDKNNVSLISVHENLDMSTPIGRMQANMIGALAQFEREQISIRTIDGLQEKASQGQYPLGNKVPFGEKVSKVAPNIVNREFKPNQKNKIWSIDITYVPQGDGNRSYLFAIKDLYDKSIIDYEVSRTMSIPFAVRSLKRAIDANDTSDVIIHSDQGVHFTCRQYVNLLESNDITISHSRKGNCHDNAPIESFFALYKKEALWLVKQYSYLDAKNQIDEYMVYYNQQRIQIGLNGKTPSEFRLSA